MDARTIAAGTHYGALAKRGKYRYFAAVGLSVLSLFAAAKVNALHYEQGGLNVVAHDVAIR